MRLQDDIDFTTLTWVKQELDDTLKQAQQALEAFVEDSSDKSQMRFCASYLHQVQGTLRMVELYGAAMVVEEMERLALGLLDGQIKQAEDAYTVLMRGMVQLPDYLERLQSGHRDIPIVLLPLLNDLRACRGEKLLSETSLFSPDLGAALPASAGGAKTAVPQPMIAANGGRLRLAFQFGLLKWFKGDDVDGNLTRLVAILDRVRSMLVQIDARRLFWVAAAALEAVLVKGVEASVALKLLVGRVDRELKRLIDAGESSFSGSPPNDLTKSLLYYVAQSKATTERISELRQIYKLDKLMPSEAELEHARGALSGHNRALLETVGTAIKEDLLRVKDALDLYLRTGSGNVEDLAPQGEALHRVADTLGMLGLGVPRRVVLDQQDILERIVRGRQPAEESALLDIAGSLLYVESSLDDHIERLGADQREVAPPSGGFELPQAEVRKILDATTKEASANIQQAKQDIVAFIESPWDHSKIEQIPRLLEEISGAMRMLNLPEPAALLQGVVRFAEVELLQHRRVPSGDQLDLMADAIASIEFYLEAVKEGRRNRDKILDVTRRSLEALGYWPLPEEGAEPATAVSIETTAPTPVEVPTAAEFPTFPDTFTTERVATPEPADGMIEAAAPTEAPVSEASAVEALIASFAQPEPPASEPEAPPMAAVEAEIRSAVEIAPGPGLESLVVGESAAEALAPSIQDLDGLRISLEPEAATAEPIDEAPAATVTAEVAPEPTVESLAEVAVAEVPEQVAPELADPLPEPSLELTTTDLSFIEEAPIDLPPLSPEPSAPAVEALAPEPVVAPRVEAPAAPPAMPPGIKLPDVGFHSVPSDEIDDEIREVFVEEVQDELDNLNRQYPAWKNDLGDLEKLKPVRRSFHTLKGSGRLVGALAIGEYAWKIENMLNRVLDKTIQPTPAVLDLLDHAIAALPGMLAALKGEGQPDANVGTIMWVAEQLATGQEVWLPKSSPAPVDTAESPASEAGAADETDARATDELAELVVAEGVQATVEPEAIAESGVDAEEMAELESREPTAIEPEAVTADLAAHAQPEIEPELPEQPLEMLEAEVAGASTLAEPVSGGGISEQFSQEGEGAESRGEAEPDAAVVEDLRDELASLEAEVAELPAEIQADEGMAQGDSGAAAEPGSEMAEPSPLDVDPMLMEILGSEVEAHLTTIRGYLAETERNGPFAVTEELLRAVHTLNGALSMVDLPVLTRVVAPLEGYLKRLRARSLEPSPDGIVALRESADCIAEVMRLLQARQPLPDTSNLAEQVLSLREGLPAPDHPFHGFGIQVADEAKDETREAAADAVGTADARPWYEAEPETAVELTEVFDASESAVDANQPDVQDEGGVEAVAPSEPESESLGDSDFSDIDHLFAEIPVESAPAPELAGESADVVQGVEADVAAEAVELSDQWFDEVPADSAPAAEPADESSAVIVQGVEADVAVEAVELSDQWFDEAPAVAAFASEPAGESEPALAEAATSQESLAETEGLDDVPRMRAEFTADLADEDTNVFQAHPADQPEVEHQAEDVDADVEDAQPAAIETDQAEDGDFEVSASEPEELAHSDLQLFEHADTHAIDAQSDEPAHLAAVPEVAGLEVATPIDAAEQPSVASDEPDGADQTVSTIAESVHVRGPVDLDPPGALDLPDMDLDLLDIFVEEGVDILDHADGMMARLRESPEDRESVASLQRDLHTLKGGARMAGLFPIGDLSHAMESLFESIAHGERSATRPAIEALEKAFDRLHGMVQRVRARQAIALPEHTIARIEMILDGREDELLATTVETGEVAGPDEAAGSSETTSPEVSQPAESTAGEEETAEAPARKVIPARPTQRGVQRKTQLDEDEAAARAAQQELIRVRADLLDNLVNFAGEVSIYRSRLEAQMGGFRFNLVEFEQTVSRLREQLRKLEMETEAQILSRFQRESEQSGNTEFDPLELDRFSTLQQLSRALAESVSDLVSIQNLLDDIARQSETLLLQQSRVSSDLQEGLMRTRMVPFESLVPRLRRILRQTAAELGKKAQLKVEGTQGEMDRTVLERMTAPFEHMLRNSLAHGIELPEVRRAKGKPEEGTVAIRVSREATEVLIQVTDDGAGMNRDAIRRKAVERGLMTQDATLSDRDIFQFVLEAGFSTASEVSKVAGRGVGMDVVASEVKQLGGSLELDSESGQGTRITIRLPFTLAVAQAVMVKLGDATYAIPMSSITGVTRMPRKELDRRIEQKNLDVVYGGETYQIYDLGDLLRQPVSHGIDETQVPLLMSRTGDQRAAVRVTQVIGSKEVVVKSAGAQLSVVPGIFGATIMGDGRVVVILDLAPLVRHGVALRQAPELAAELELLEPVVEPAARRQPLVMVVDDSITMRKVTTRVLERSNFDVFTAKDGLDAVEQLQDRMPDVILLDIEMPRMDGYEVATYIRNDQRLKHIPIIMITSRTGEKHRQRALEVGVDRYLGKPYQETDLLKNVQDALTAGHANVH